MGGEPIVIVAEPQFKGVTHAVVNAALLQATGIAFPEARLVFQSPPEHARWIRQTLESTTTSGMMATAAGLLFALAAVFSPSRGVIARLGRRVHAPEPADTLTGP